jgi:hypothetical protein
MSRRMSCAMTVDAVRERRKTVTRRHPDTWTGLKAGDRLTLIEKGMGLKKGERHVVLAEVEVTSVTVQMLSWACPTWEEWESHHPTVTPEEVEAEGMAMAPEEFAIWWAESHGYRNVVAAAPPGLPITYRYALGLPRGALTPETVLCRRIEWRYLP